MVGRQIARYRILSEISKGGMGEVYLAEDTDLLRPVALKVLPADVARDPGRLALFRQEARAIAAVNHPNIVVIHSVEETDGLHFMTMELIEGRTLSQVLAEDDLTLDFLFDLALPLCAALEAAHAHGVTHRDLKPANIMLTTDGRVKILDFGLALVVPERRSKAAAAGGPGSTQPPSQPILGTPDYMSPEQAAGRPADHRSDIFSLGVLLYRVATGRRPFTGATSGEVLAAVLRDTPRPPHLVNPDCPLALGLVIERCLAKEPRNRYASVTDLRAELQEIRREVCGAEEQVPSVAVLPFADLSPQKDQEYFCDGVAEEIINALTAIHGLKVVSRMSSFQYRELGGDSRDIGRRLGVRTLLEGSVRKAGDQLRIMAQLIDVDDGYHIWSQRFDRDLSDVFAVQDEIAQSVLKALRLTLAAGPSSGLVAARTSSPAAYDFYLRGRDFFRRWGKRNIEIALRMFAHASGLDPGFASAHAGMADAYCYLYMYINSSQENLDQADRHSARALDLDPALAEGHAARGLSHSLHRHHEAAEREFKIASELDPNLFEAYYFHARDCVVQGRYEDAIVHYREAAAASPDDYQIPILSAQICHTLGRDAEERELNAKGLELAEKAILINPEDARACYMGAGAMVRLGQRERGLKWARRALTIDPDDPAILYNVACVYAVLDQLEEAIDCLERTVKAGASYKEWMENDSDLDALRGHERFKALLAGLQ